MRKLFLFLLLLPALAQAANVPNIVAAQVPDAERVGNYQFSKFFFHVYDATLFAPRGRYHPSVPAALQLRYQMKIKGKDIASRTVDEMRRNGISDEAALARWEEEILRLMPDVSPGTVLTGIRYADGSMQFFDNQTPLGKVGDPAFGAAFFDIWLSPQTSEPSMRRALLGL